MRAVPANPASKNCDETILPRNRNSVDMLRSNGGMKSTSEGASGVETGGTAGGDIMEEFSFILLHKKYLGKIFLSFPDIFLSSG